MSRSASTTPERLVPLRRPAPPVEPELDPVVGALTLGVVVHGDDGRVTQANAAAAEILGLTLDELLGRAPRDRTWRAVREDGSPFPLDALPPLVALRTGDAVRGVVLGIDAPARAERRWVRIEAAPVRDPRSSARRVVATLQDVTDRRRAARRLAATAELARAFNACATREAYCEAVLGWALALTGCRAGGLRLVNGHGELPYAASRGLDASFLDGEGCLSLARDDCTCTRVLTGAPGPSDRAATTAGGSFRCGDLPAFLAALPSGGAAAFRGACRAARFRSLAVIAIAHGGARLGVLQLADERPDLLPPEELELLEQVVPFVAEAFQRLQAEEALARSRDAERALGHIRAAASADLPLDALLGRALEVIAAHAPGARVVAADACVADAGSGRALTTAGWRDPQARLDPLPAWTDATPRFAASLEFQLLRAAGGGAGAGIYRVPVEAGAGARGELRVCVAATRRAPDLEPFLLAAAGVLGGVVERELARTDLERSRRDFRAVIDALPTLIAIHRDGVVLWANAAFARRAGVPQAALAGRRMEELAAPEERADARAWVERTYAGACGLHPRTLLSADGARVPLEVSGAAPIVFDGVLAHVTVAQDVSERRRLEDQLVAAERLGSLGTLAAGVAHEINNPLAYVIGNLGFAADAVGELPAELPGLDELRASLSDAAEGAERVRAIVSDLRTFSRVDDQTVGAVDVRAALDGALAMARSELKHRARVVRAYAEVPPVRANAARLGQVFLNLVVNAAQAIAPGALDRNEVRLGVARADEGWVAVEVRDTGAGIPPEVLPRIFEPFYTTKPLGVGTGLGLSICHGIVSAIGGRIEVESACGAGTTFRVFLPVADAGAIEERPAPAPAPARRGRVLVVDDEPQVADALRRLLRDAHDVEAATGATALARLEAGPPLDAVLCDLVMPETTGLALHAAVAARAPAIARRFVFLTGGAIDPEAREALRTSGQPVLDKPIDLAALRAALGR